MTRRGLPLACAVALLLAPGQAFDQVPGPLDPPAPAADTGRAAPLPPPEPLRVRAYRLTHRDRLDPAILDAALDWDLDPFLFRALLWVESGLQPGIVNPRSGAAGIGQFTAVGRRGLERIRAARGEPGAFTRADALDPDLAIPAAAELLAYQVDRWGTFHGVAAYNGGKAKRAFARGVLRQARRFRLEAALPPDPPPARRPSS